MSDFSEIENDLRNLRPAQPSPILLQRVDEALTHRKTAFVTTKRTEVESDAGHWRTLLRVPANWLAWGSGLAAAAVLILFTVISIEQSQDRGEDIAQVPTSSETATAPSGHEARISSPRFVPAGATRVVYNTRDEGLQFTEGSQPPVRRVRYEARQTWQWRNPTTGASLRVSYPSEVVMLIPISGQ